jgi:signal transduction histidine kinase
VVGNPTQLHQVVLNLCVNAKDAMPEGGQLHLEADNIVLKEKNLPKSVNARFGNFVKLTVKDTGTGISKAVLSKIFDPFFTTKSDGKGTGLGLSTVQTIVKNHGGFMDIKSKINKGSEFVIYLPATPPAPHSISNGDTEQYHLNAVRLNRF